MLFDRTGGQGTAAKQQVSKPKQFRGPVLGWITSNNLGEGPDGGAELLLNIIPDEAGRARPGWKTALGDHSGRCRFSGVLQFDGEEGFRG